MTLESKPHYVCDIPRLMICRHSDYLGADNAGLHALLLRRTGEAEWKGAEPDFRTINKSPDVVKDLHGVVGWIKKSNATCQG
jgi:hypothetical protein